MSSGTKDMSWGENQGGRVVAQICHLLKLRRAKRVAKKEVIMMLERC